MKIVDCPECGSQIEIDDSEMVIGDLYQHFCNSCKSIFYLEITEAGKASVITIRDYVNNHIDEVLDEI